jgi:hypothetical protein
MLRQTREMIRDRLAGAGEKERSAAAHGAEVNLQAAISANVVERAPDGSAVGGAWGVQRRREAFEIVHDQLRHAGRARGHQHPFGAHARQRACAHRRDRRRASHAYGKRKRLIWRRAVVDHHGVDAGDGDHGAKMFRRSVGRQDHDTARDTVKLDQRQSARELACGGEQHRPPGEFRQTAAETRPAIEIGEADRRGAIPEESGRLGVRDGRAQR